MFITINVRNVNNAVFPVFLLSLTDVHYGTFQDVSSFVKNPFYKNSLGIPVIRGEAIKGSLAKNFIDRIKDTNQLSLLSFLFGTSSIAGLLAVYDFELLFLPVPEMKHGLVFITSPYLIHRFARILNLYADNMTDGTNTHNIVEFLNFLSKLSAELNNLANYYSITTICDKYLSILGDLTFKVYYEPNLLTPLREMLKFILPNKIFNEINIAIVSDSVLPLIITKGVNLHPGVKLQGFVTEDHDLIFFNKSVSKSVGPWFWEALPKFSILAGAIIFNKIRATKLEEIFNSKEKITEILKEFIANRLADEIKITTSEINISVNEKALLDFLKKKIIGKINDSIVNIGGLETKGYGLMLVKIFDKNMLETVSNVPRIQLNIAKNTIDFEYKDIYYALYQVIIQHKSDLLSKSTAENTAEKIEKLLERIIRSGLSFIAFYYSAKSKRYGDAYEFLLSLVDKVLEYEKPNVQINAIKQLYLPKGKNAIEKSKNILFLDLIKAKCMSESRLRENIETIYSDYYRILIALNKMRQIIRMYKLSE